MLRSNRRLQSERTHGIRLNKPREDNTLGQTEFVYVTYIKATPEAVWRALTETEFIQKYFDGGGPKSDWKVGSPVLWKMDEETGYRDWGQQVIEVDPPRRLSYSWHDYQPEMQKYFGWTDEQLEEMRKEPIARVTFEVEPALESPIRPGRTEWVKLTLIHDNFVPGSEMLKGISEGWPVMMSKLKTEVERI